MRKILISLHTFFLLGCGLFLHAQDSLPRIIIGDVSVYESSDSIVGEGIQGHVAYDAATNTLFLDNATIPSLRTCGTEGHFKVKLSGSNSVGMMITRIDSCTFFGPGSLNLGGTSATIALNCARTRFLALSEGASLDITASDIGIKTLYDHMADQDSVLHYPLFVIDNSSLVITAPTCCTVMWAWWLSECHVVAPADFEYQLDTWFFPEHGTVLNYMEIRPGTVGIDARDPVAFNVWPNPTDDLLHIELSGTEIATVALYDLQGRMVTGVFDTPLRTGATATVNLRNVPAGVYLLRVTDAEGHEHHRKVVKR